MNTTSEKYFKILNKYWLKTKGEKIVILIDKRGNFAHNKESLKEIFSDTEEIDIIVTKLFFTKKILIARPSGGYWGVTCVMQPTLEMADGLRLEANNIKLESRSNIKKKEIIESKSDLFKQY